MILDLREKGSRVGAHTSPEPILTASPAQAIQAVHRQRVVRINGALGETEERGEVAEERFREQLFDRGSLAWACVTRLREGSDLVFERYGCCCGLDVRYWGRVVGLQVGELGSKGVFY